MAKKRKKSKPRKWMRKAFSKNKGALTTTAKKAGALNKDGTISVTWMRAQVKKGGVTGKRALAVLNARKSRKRKR